MADYAPLIRPTRLRKSSMASSASRSSLPAWLDLAIEAVGLEGLEPGAEFRALVGRQAGEGFLEVFDAHNANIVWDLSRCRGIARARDPTNLNNRCRNCKNPPRTRSNSAAAGSSNRVH